MMEGEDSESDDERAFNKKTVWQRIQVVAAGPVFNFILAYLLAVLFIGIAGYDAPVIASVEEGYPAQEAGIEPGDRITKLNGYPVHFYSEIRLYNFFHPGRGRWKWPMRGAGRSTRSRLPRSTARRPDPT